MNKLLAMVVVLILAAGAAGTFYYWKYVNKTQPVAVPLEIPPQDPSPAEQAPSIIHPVPDDPAEAVQLQGPVTTGEADPEAAQKQAVPVLPLPALDASDPDMRATLSGLFDRQTLETLFNLDRIIRRVVMTVDNLPRSKLSMRHAINQPTSGPFLTLGEDDNRVLDPANFSRYTPFVRVAEAIDSDEMVSLYVRFYPLFQQAYEELGYPSAYFNDRLVEVIDHLLAAPNVSGPIQLRQPHIFYTFADPELEALSAGQKLLIRVGPANAARLKAKLRELRKVLATGAS